MQYLSAVFVLFCCLQHTNTKDTLEGENNKLIKNDLHSLIKRTFAQGKFAENGKFLTSDSLSLLKKKLVQENLEEKDKVKRELHSRLETKVTGFKWDGNMIETDTGIPKSRSVKLQSNKNDIPTLNECKQEENCLLPACFCPTDQHPFMNLTSIPQIVYFALSGSLKMEHWKLFSNLFNYKRKNPDGRLATVSFYVGGKYVDYDLVKYIYDNNYEIGVSGTITDGGYYQVVQKGDIPLNDLVGFNCLASETLCNENDVYLHELGYSYIIRENVQEQLLLWPYTSIMNRNSAGLRSSRPTQEFWNIPVNGIFQNNGSICVSSHVCLSTVSSESNMFDFIWNKFKHTFETTRSPLGIHLDMSLFQNGMYFKVFDKFISKVLKMKSVFIVDVLKMIKWIRNPTKINSLSKFKPWNVGHSRLEETQQEISKANGLKERHMKDNSIAVGVRNDVQNDSVSIQKNTVSTKTPHCYQGVNCKLPSCFCPTHKFPMIDVNKIPQIIYFGFDDYLGAEHKKIYDKLFFTNRRNPNGCPITISLYVSNTNTDYNVVRYYYKRGNDIGVHSVTHKLIKTRSTLLQEANDQLMNLVTRAGIPRNKIVGWRSPYLETAGDIQIDVLQQLGFQYDISLINPYLFTVNASQGSYVEPSHAYWPFTLDHNGWPSICYLPPCPKRPHTGFWEVPLNELVDIKRKGACSMTDDCPNLPQNENEVFQYLWHNFEGYYKGNRAPFGMHMHPTWFKSEFNLNGLDKFIREALKLENVYIVSVRKMLEWVKNPVPEDRIKEFEPWLCE